MRRITKLGGLLVGIGAGAAAIVWLVKDRLLGPEAAPVGVEEAPAFRVSPGPPTALAEDSDDLSAVKGIGPVYRARLEQAGITTFRGMAAAAASSISEAAEVSLDRAEEWIRQAAALASE